MEPKNKFIILPRSLLTIKIANFFTSSKDYASSVA